MPENSTESKINQALSSLALFGALYDLNQNIYDVLGKFLKYVIINSSSRCFNLTELACSLNKTFHFSIPEAIVKTSLKNADYIKKKNNKNQYVVDITDPHDIEFITTSFEKTKKENYKIIEALFSFIEDKQKGKLSEEKKNVIRDTFYSYMLDDKISTTYVELISAFILEKRNDADFLKNLRMIKDGVIVYSGLKYNVNSFKNWDTELTIFLDTEILFHACGYNGELFKTLFDDFYNLVQEINATIKKIHLKYFKETEDDIEKFFLKAEYIVQNKEVLDPSRPAMIYIVNGVNTKSEIVTKKASFYHKINEKDIFLDTNTNYYSSNQYILNIEDSGFIDRIQADLDVEYDNNAIMQSLKLLSHINVLRNGDNNKGFVNIGFIFLTGKNITAQVAWHETIKNSSDVPLATSLEFLTNKFWFKLNKGFGGTKFPKSFDIITKAQLILSFQNSLSIGKRFDDLKHKSANKEMTEDEIYTSYIYLRNQAKYPEEILDHQTIEDVLLSIDESKIESMSREMALKESKLKKDNEDLKEKVRKKDELIQKYKKEENERKARKEKRCKISLYFLSGLILMRIVIFLLFKNWIGSALSLLGALAGIILFWKKIEQAITSLTNRIVNKEL